MRIVVAGTGTEIGKTHIACALTRELSERDRVVALKPIESGGVEDARALSAACGADIPPLYALRDPISPHLAARREGVTIDGDRVASWVGEHARAITIIETAGGLFSPLGANATNATLASALDPDVLLLVAPDRLGVLHDVTATLRAWGERARPRLVVVMSAPPDQDAATSTNAAELATLGIAEVVVVFPRAAPDATATRDAAAVLARHLYGLRKGAT